MERGCLLGVQEKGGLRGREAAHLGCLVGLQGQEVGLPESTGSLAEGPEKGSLAEAGRRPQGSAGDGEKGTDVRGRAREDKTNRPAPRPSHHLHAVTIRGGHGVGHVTGKRLAARCSLLPHGQGAGDPHRQAPLPPPPGPRSLSLHTPGGHIHHLDVRVPQAPVEAQALAGVGGGVGGGH